MRIASFATLPLVVFTFVLSIAMPIALAQNDAMRAAVRSALLNDPRAADLPQTQLEEMVNTLAVAVEKQGITPRDIEWKPEPVSSFTPTSIADLPASCDGGTILCALSKAFGFYGSDMSIPIWIGISSSILVLVLWLMIEAHRKKYAQQQQPIK